MNLITLIQQARRMNHQAIHFRAAGRHLTASLCVDFRNINMRHARELA
jgi:hypothetical protein